jgi:hypothetical protein
MIMSTDLICPIGDIYLQATRSKAGAMGLLVSTISLIFCATISCYITSGRTIYTLGRDGATPFARQIGAVSSKWHSPLSATLAYGIFVSCTGAIYVGSSTAFNAFISSFALLTTLSYLLTILLHLITGRKGIRPGPFWIGEYGFLLNTVAYAYIVVSFVIYSFPCSLPTNSESMNYTIVITYGMTILVGAWCVIHSRKNFQGSQLEHLE